MADILEIRREAMQALRPPAKIDLADWVQENVILPSSLSAHPGKMRLWPHQIEIARSIGDPLVERVVLLKSARVGFTQLAVAALGNFVVNDPSPMLVVLPAEDDTRNFMVGNLLPVFEESPVLRDALMGGNGAARDTLYDRRFVGGSLKLVSARSPRNLRALTAKVLLLDEVDGYEIDLRGEGDPVELAIRRTATYAPRRKIILGSTPVHEDTSRILRAYEKSDRRIYECACPSCGDWHELQWQDIHWLPDQPETAHWACPSCGGIVEDREKGPFISGGRWRATRPEITDCHGYRVSALISLLPVAAWPRLAIEFLEAKKSPQTLQTFVNTVLGQPWRDNDGDHMDDAALFNRREPFDLDSIPPEVLFLTGGIDVQDDRVEISWLGWTREGHALVLAHEIVWGSPLDNETWAHVDDLLKRTFKHPLTGTLRLDCAIVDSGSGGHTDAVYGFCRPRVARRIFPGKGMAGFQRPAVQLSAQRTVRLQIIGVDAIKNQIVNRVQAGTTIRFSHTLDANWFEQFTAEKRVVRYTRGQPVRAFERISGRRSEAIDCVTYAFAAKALISSLDPDRREAELSTQAAVKPPMPTVIKSKWLDR